MMKTLKPKQTLQSKYTYTVQLEKLSGEPIDRKVLLSILPEGVSLRTISEDDDETLTTIQIFSDIKINVNNLKSKLKTKEDNGSLFKAKPLSLEQRLKAVEDRLAQLEQQ